MHNKHIHKHICALYKLVHHFVDHDDMMVAVMITITSPFLSLYLLFSGFAWCVLITIIIIIFLPFHVFALCV